MMRKYTSLIALLLLTLIVKAEDNHPYAANKIDPKLLTDAHAVIRICEQEIEVDALDKILIKEHYVITILGREGDKYAKCSASFSKLDKIEKIYGSVYDRNGERKMKVRESDFQTLTATLNPGYYEDNKIMVYKASYREYPYTVEFYTVTRQIHSFYMPMWIVRPDYDIAVEQSSYRVIAPTSFSIRYKAINGTLNPSVSKENGNDIYDWNISSVPAEKEEYLVVEDFKGSPALLVAPAAFKLDEYYGDMSDWKSMGSFLYNLNKDRDQLSDEKKERVKALVSGLDDPYEKISVLYRYMQEHTRYVSIQYGVGGWQTLEAKFVSDNQYGDCKALSNYMMAMLKEADIPSYPVVIYAGSEDYFRMPLDFSVNIFNHEILCIPLGNDTVWLECTSRDHPSGYLGSFTADRNALMITSEGGVVVRTPGYGVSHNVISHTAKGKCNEDGSLSILLRNHYSGIPAEPMMGWSYMTNQEKDQYINSKLHLSSYSTDTYNIARTDNKGMLCIDEQFSITANNLINKTAGYQLLDMNLVPVRIPFDIQVSARRKSFSLPVSYQVHDTFDVAMPVNTVVNALPETVEVESAFGSYHFSVEHHGGNLIAIRRFILKGGKYDPEQYADYEAWVDLIDDQKHYKVILQNK